MKPAAFVYHRAGSVDETVALLSELGDDAKILAGGQSLVPMMNLRLARPSALVDIGRVPGLSYVVDDGDVLRVGALARHRDIEHHPAPLPGLSILPRSAHWIGHYPIREIGTFGGAIAHADAAAEWPLLARLLGADLLVAGPSGRRVIAAADFFVGLFTTDLAPDELLIEVRFGHRPAHGGLAEFARRRGDFAIVCAAAAFDLADGRCADVRIALGGVDAVPVRIADAEAVLEGEEPSDEAVAEAARVAAEAIDPPDDTHGDAAYRRDLANALVRRAWDDAVEHDG